MKYLLSIFIVLAISGPFVQMQNNPSYPYKKMLEDPVDFSGWAGMSYHPADLAEIRFGFFAPNNPDDPVGSAMLKGATLAILEANQAGGYGGVPFRLVHRWANDPWKAGSNEMIKLVYEDQVWAIIGSFNGESSHIAEQIVTKARLPLLSPISSDPTLTHIRIPWIFRIPPDDHAQADLLIREGIIPMSIQRIGLITSTNHDGRIAASEFHQALKKRKLTPVYHFQISPDEVDYQHIVRHSASFNPDGILLRLPKEQLIQIMDYFREENLSCPLFLPWIPGLQEESLTSRYHGRIVMVQPFSMNRRNPRFSSFLRAYQKKFGSLPDPCAAYSYDAVNILVNGILTAGLNRAELREAISKANVYEGVTGRIVWDNGGGNVTLPVVSTIGETRSSAAP